MEIFKISFALFHTHFSKIQPSDGEILRFQGLFHPEILENLGNFNVLIIIIVILKQSNSNLIKISWLPTCTFVLQNNKVRLLSTFTEGEKYIIHHETF